MCSQINRIQDLKEFKEKNIKLSAENNTELNQFHDSMLKQVYYLILEEYVKEKGTPPTEFVWFVTGSAGRSEQGLFSDQDHGIVYLDSTTLADDYFLEFGKKLSDGLNKVGYPYCEGKVMSSNPVWCKSLSDWEKQLLNWLTQESWESIRYLQIFYDSRQMVGELPLVEKLRNFIHEYKTKHPTLLNRFLNNVMRIQKGVGIFGQFFVERSGPHKGSIHLKNTLYLPYVNSIRLLALKEGITASSTIGRMIELKNIEKYEAFIIPYEGYFKRILEYRIFLFKEAKTYSDVHFLNIKELNREERHEIKQLLRNGIKLYHQVQRIIEKGC